MAAAAAVVIGYYRPIETSLFLTRSHLFLQGERSHDAAIDGHRIHYREMGQGEPLLLLHGLGGSSLDWAPVIPIYANAGYHVYAPDLLGHGASDAPDIAYSMEEQARMVHDFMLAQHIPQADVIGWSMGGWIAMKLTLEHPESVHRLVVNDTAGLFYRPNFKMTLFIPSTLDEVNALYSLLEPKAAPMPQFVARDLTRRIREQNGWVVSRTIASMLSMSDLLDGKLSAIKQPVLIVWGADDALIPVSNGYELAREIPQADLEVFKGCAHLAPARCAQPVADKTLQFLRSGNPPQGMTQQIAVNVLYWFPH